MITSIANNIGISQVNFKDYQTEGFTVLQGKFDVDPTSSAWQAADQIVFEFDSLVMIKSSIGAVYMIDSREPERYYECFRGTVLKSWIKNNKLYIEKVDHFDNYGPLHFYIATGYAKGGQRTQIVKDGFVNTGIENAPSETKLDRSCLMVKEGYVFLQMMFKKFYGIDRTTTQAFDITGMPSDVDVYFPVVYSNVYIQTAGHPLSEGHISNGHFTCTNPGSATFVANEGTFFHLFAVRDVQSNSNSE